MSDCPTGPTNFDTTDAFKKAVACQTHNTLKILLLCCQRKLELTAICKNNLQDHEIKNSWKMVTITLNQPICQSLQHAFDQITDSECAFSLPVLVSSPRLSSDRCFTHQVRTPSPVDSQVASLACRAASGFKSFHFGVISVISHGCLCFSACVYIFTSLQNRTSGWWAGKFEMPERGHFSFDKVCETPVLLSQHIFHKEPGCQIYSPKSNDRSTSLCHFSGNVKTCKVNVLLKSKAYPVCGKVLRFEAWARLSGLTIYSWLAYRWWAS